MKNLNRAVIYIFSLILSALIAMCFQSCGNAEAYPNNTIPSVYSVKQATVEQSTVEPDEVQAEEVETQCKATTKAGTQCSRKAAEGESYCWQHGGSTKAEAAGTATSSSGTCGAKTKAGTACKNRVKGGGKCHLHKG